MASSSKTIPVHTTTEPVHVEEQRGGNVSREEETDAVPKTSTTSSRPETHESASTAPEKRNSSAEAQKLSSHRGIEEPKPVCHVSLWKAVRRSVFIHLLPVAVNFALLVLCARTTYFSDLENFEGQVFLQALQFAVKAHEIIMTLSIADIVLHRIRWDLLKAGGVPLGLMTSAYRLSQVDYLVSTEFWSSVWKPWSAQRKKGLFSLSILIGLAVGLSFIVGPSSGVIMIPKLAWWSLSNPFGSTTFRTFIANCSQDIIWPSVLEEYPCGGWGCPTYGIGNIVVWVANLGTENAQGGIPFEVGRPTFYRWITSNATGYTTGWTAATSNSMAVGAPLGEYWNWAASQGLQPAVSVEQSRLTIQWRDGGSMFKPVVQVQCSTLASNGTADVVRFPNSQIQGSSRNLYSNATWPVPTPLRDLNLSTMDSFAYGTANVSELNDPPSAALVLAMRDENYTRNILPCAVVAHWVPVELFIEPKLDRNIHDNSSNPLSLFNNSHVDLSALQQIMFSNNWSAMLLEDDALESVLSGLSVPSACDNCPLTYPGGEQGLAYKVSTVFGVYIADAIARYTPNGDTVAWQTPGNSSEQPFATFIGNFIPATSELYPGLQNYSNFLRYALDNAGEWREILIPFQRRGYAWSFKGALAKLAACVLILQSLMALVHIGCLILGRWTSSIWASTGALVACALSSDPTSCPSNVGAGVEKNETWAQQMEVRAREGKLELIFGHIDGLEEPRPGQAYS